MARTKSQGNGEGAIVTIKRNGKIAGYAPEMTVGWQQGKRIRKRGAMCKTRGEARIALEKLKAQHQSGMDVTSRPQKVREFFPDWLNTTFALTARPRSVATYRWAIEKVIIPHLGDLQLAKVTARQIDRMLATVQQGEHKLSPKSASMVRTVLRQGFNQARKWHLIDHNPVQDTNAPKVGRSHAKAFTPEQAAAFLAAARGHRLELALRLTLVLGLRRGETCGLHWTDIDWDAGTLTINGSLGYVPPAKAGERGRLEYGAPKTEAGRRVYRLSAALLADLRWHQRRQRTERAAMGAAWKPDEGFIFISTKTGGRMQPHALYLAFKTIAESVGLGDFRLHDLRHTAATFAYALGHQDKAISTYLGHANTSITKDLYTHLLPGALDSIPEQIERLTSTDNANQRRAHEG